MRQTETKHRIRITQLLRSGGAFAVTDDGRSVYVPAGVRSATLPAVGEVFEAATILGDPARHQDTKEFVVTRILQRITDASGRPAIDIGARVWVWDDGEALAFDDTPPAADIVAYEYVRVS